MKKTWVFFKLRLLQLKYDRTALFFSYILPTLLLVGIGLPKTSEDTNALVLRYRDAQNNAVSKALVSQLESHVGLETVAMDQLPADMGKLMTEEGFGFFLDVRADGGFDLYHQTSSDRSPLVVDGIEHALAMALGGNRPQGLTTHPVEIPQESYIKTLMPGLIGMTLLVIGLNGFGMVLVQERDRGVFRKIKTMDASPLGFLGGLLLSRLLVCYGVVMVMNLITRFVFGIDFAIDYLLLFLVVTLGCAAFLLMGLALAVIAKTQSAFNGLTNFIMIPLIVFSGAFFSINSFPGWLQIISKMLPLTHFNLSLQKLFFESVTLSQLTPILPELMGMGIWAVVLGIFVKLKFEW